MKQLKCIVKSIMLISLIVSLSSCDMLSGGKNKDTKKETNPKAGNTVQFLRFRPKNANVLGIVDTEDSPNTSVRSAATDALIVNIMEDGSLQNFLSLPEGTGGKLADILMILQSPNPDNDCFYIVLDGNSFLITPETKSKEYENEDGEIVVETWVENQDLPIGPILCIFADGSYSDFVHSEPTLTRRFDKTLVNSVSVDNNGNLYYLLQEFETDEAHTYANPLGYAIYMYDPSTNEAKRIKLPVRSEYYKKIQVSADGKWCFVEGYPNNSSSTSYYLRAIPVSNPEAPVNVFYNTDGDLIYDWVYDDDTETVYYSLKDGIHKNTMKNDTFSQDYDEILCSEDTSYWNYFDKEKGLFVEEDTVNHTYNWNPELKDGEAIDAKKVLERLTSICAQGEIDFKLTAFKDDENFGSLYTDKINDEAIQFLDTPENTKTFLSYIDGSFKPIYGYAKILNVTCFIKGTEETAYPLPAIDDSKIIWASVKNMTTAYQKSLYANDSEGFIELLDKNGRRKGIRVNLEGSPKLHVVRTYSADDGVYFQNSILNNNGKETGKHNIFFYDVKNNKLENLFENVTNKDKLEIISFSGGKNAVYFSAVNGFDIISGKIDTQTKAYTELGSEQKLTQIIVVK